MRNAARWVLLTGVCYLLGVGAEILGFPAPYLVAAIVAGAVAALMNAVRRLFPRPATNAAHAVVGVLMGSYVDPDSLGSVAASAAPLTVVTAATIGMGVVIALGLARTARLGVPTAVLSMVPGGSAAIVAAADQVRADPRLVAFTQYLRVGLVALTAPAVAAATRYAPSASSGAPRLADKLGHVVEAPNQVAGVLVLVAVCVLGVQGANRLSLPAATVLGPMVLAAVVLFTGTAHGFAPAGALRDLVFTVVGLEVGLRFTRASVRHAGRALPHVLLGTTLLCLLCAGLAAMLGAVVGMPFMDAYLATTPGGINAVLATAASTHSDVVVVSTVQSIRLFATVLLAPPIIAWVMRRAGAANVPGARQPEVRSVPATS